MLVTLPGPALAALLRSRALGYSAIQCPSGRIGSGQAIPERGHVSMPGKRAKETAGGR